MSPRLTCAPRKGPDVLACAGLIGATAKRKAGNDDASTIRRRVLQLRQAVRVEGEPTGASNAVPVPHLLYRRENGIMRMNVHMRAPQAGCPLVMAVAILLAVLHPGLPHATEASACGEKVTIERGQTLSSIARNCSTSVSQLLAANPQIGDPDTIAVGTEIKIPRRDVANVPGPATGGEAVVPEERIRLQAQSDDRRPGAQITLSASDLPANAMVWIKGGWSRTGQLILRRGRTDAEGNLRILMRLPRLSGRGERPGQYQFSVDVPQIGQTIWSEPLEVRPPAKEAPGTDQRKARPDAPKRLAGP